MIRRDFEAKLRDAFLMVRISDETENRTVYQVRGENFHDGRIVITDGDPNDIMVSIDAEGKETKTLMFYDLPSAYEWAYSRICNLDDGWRQEQTRRYDFSWEPGDDIYGVVDGALEGALKMCYYGRSRPVSYCDGDILLKTYGTRVVSDQEIAGQEYDPVDDENPAKCFALRYIRLKSDAPIGEYKRRGDSVSYEYPILNLCGYLDYLDGNGELTSFLQKREQIRDQFTQPCGPYSFTWRPQFGLSRLPENLFRLALQIAQSGLIRLDRDLTDKNCVRIHSPQWACLVRMTESYDSEISSSFIAQTVEQQRQTSRDNNTNTIEINVTAPLSVSDRSKPFISIYNYAAYILYLQDCENDECIERDRHLYLENLKANEVLIRRNKVFTFSLSEDQFMDVPDEVIEVAELLQEENFVSFSTHIWKDRYRIRYAEAVLDYMDMSLLKQAIATGKVSRSKTAFSEPFFGRRLDSYNPEEYGILHKLILVAGYIDYLRKAGKYMDFRELRWEVHQNRSREVDEFSCEGRTLENVFATADNDSVRSLHYVIDGEYESGKNGLVEQIADHLVQAGKIESAEPEFYTFERLAAYLGYSCSHNGRDNSSFMVYEEFQQNKLYVLNGLKEFLHHCKDVTKDDDSREAHFIDLLSRYRPNTYIIVVGEKEYVDSFLNLSPQIRFLFGENVIRVLDMSADKMYSVFLSALSYGLRWRAEVDSVFRERFIQYVDRNREILPLRNRELAEYLANYANDRGMLDLPSDINSRQPVNEMMKNVIGLENVKRNLEKFRKYAVYRTQAESRGMKLPDTRMHMVFTGNPGTGKSTVARILADMLYSSGVSKTNKLVEVERKDLIGEYIGQTAQKTARVIESALGGILFIDEAYTLTPTSERDFAGEAIATLVKAMEDHRDDLIVIFAGYEKKMQEFLNVNPGLQSRIGYTFLFNDYSTEELVQIFDTKIREAGFIFPNRKEKEKVFAKVSDLCDYFKKDKNFGNARFVDSIVQSAIMARSQRKYSDKSIQKLSAADIPGIRDMASTDVLPQGGFEAQLDAFVGMETTKKLVREFAEYAKLRQNAAKAGKNLPGGNMNMLFTGNPGTGKTSMARIMAQMLCSIGITMTARLVEVNAVELLGRYVGQTAERTSAVIERAMGGVLFIDEAYALMSSGNNSGEEAITILLTAMEDHKDNLVVIFAGYGEEMDRFLDINPGIRSRIGFSLEFDDYTPDQLIQIFNRKLMAAGIEYDNEIVSERVRDLCVQFRGEKNFGNGRFVDQIIQRALIKHASQNDQDEAASIIITGDDIPRVEEIRESMGVCCSCSSKMQIGFQVK